MSMPSSAASRLAEGEATGSSPASRWVAAGPALAPDLDPSPWAAAGAGAAARSCSGLGNESSLAPISPSKAPTGSVAPGAAATLPRIPPAGASTVAFTFPVRISSSSSPSATASPSETSQRTTVAFLMAMPSLGTRTSVITEPVLERVFHGGDDPLRGGDVEVLHHRREGHRRVRRRHHLRRGVQVVEQS